MFSSHMDFQLTPIELEQLRSEQRRTNLSRRRYRKVTVLIMRHQGYSVAAVEAALGIDDNTIYRYERGFRKASSLSEFLDDSYVAYQGRLTAEQEQQLCDHLDETLYPNASSIVDYVVRTFGVKYTVGGMTALLHRLGFVYKQSRSVPAKADDEAQRSFLLDTLPELLDQVKEGQAVLYYTDGCHPTHNTKSSRGWIRKGADFEVACNNGRQRVNINGAVRADRPSEVVYDLAETINAQSTQRLAEQLLAKHPEGTIYLVCDNARYNRNRQLLDWSADKRVEFVYLPTYSPNLNLIERLWRFLRQRIINSTYYEKYASFREAVAGFLEHPEEYKAELERLMVLNFRTIGGTSVRLSQTIFG